MSESIAQRINTLPFDDKELRTLFNAILADLAAVRGSVSGILTGSATFDAGSLADGVGETTTVTVTGAALGDFAVVSLGVSTQGITVTANVTAANTVTVRLQNETTGVIDLASTTLRALVFPLATAAPAALTLAA